jgi:hypothetical protein
VLDAVGQVADDSVEVSAAGDRPQHLVGAAGVALGEHEQALVVARPELDREPARPLGDALLAIRDTADLAVLADERGRSTSRRDCSMPAASCPRARATKSVVPPPATGSSTLARWGDPAAKSARLSRTRVKTSLVFPL